MLEESAAEAIAEAIAAGYAAAAEAIGFPHQVYRPSGPTDPLAIENMVTTLPAAWKPASPGDKFRGANAFGKATWFGYYDLDKVVVGDYLMRSTDGSVFYIAAQQPLLQPLGVECNAVVTITRPGAANSGDTLPHTRAFGAIEYGGSATPGTILSGWPASLLQGTKGEKSDAALPRDTRQPSFLLTLPCWPGTDIRTDDRVEDARGYAYLVSSAELSALGWRCQVTFIGA